MKKDLPKFVISSVRLMPVGLTAKQEQQVEEKLEAKIKALKKRSEEITDTIMLGDSKEAMALLKDFEAF